MAVALLVIAGLVLLAVLALAYQLRNARRDSRSVEAHHQLLDRLQHAAEAHPELPVRPSVAAHVRVVPNAAARRTSDAPVASPAEVPAPPPPPPVSEAAPPVPVAEAPSPPAGEPVVAGAGASATASASASASANAGASGSGSDSASEPHWAATRLPLAMIHPVGSRRRFPRLPAVRLPRPAWPRPPRRVAVATAALLVAGASTAIGLVVTGGNAPAARGPGSHLASPPGGATHLTLPASPASTLPLTPPTVTATSTGPTGATYVVTSTAVDLTVAASNRCWVELRSGSSTGPILFEGLIVAGTSHAFSNSSGVWLRLGYPPGVRVQLNGTRVSLPATAQPYDVSVQTA